MTFPQRVRTCGPRRIAAVTQPRAGRLFAAKNAPSDETNLGPGTRFDKPWRVDGPNLMKKRNRCPPSRAAYTICAQLIHGSFSLSKPELLIVGRCLKPEVATDGRR